MRRPGHGRPSPATVIACIALAISLSGVAYAAVVPSPNSVGTRQLKPNAVTSPKVKNNSLTGLDIREASLAQVPSAASAANADSLDELDAAAFLRANAAAGGSLTGSYPNPALADGAVSSLKLTDGAVTTAKLAANSVDASKVADGSLRLVDLAAWTLAGNIGGSANLAAACHYFNFGTPTGAQPGDLIVVRSGVGVPGGLALNAYLRADGGVTGGTCNFTNANVALPNPFVLTIYGVR